MFSALKAGVGGDGKTKQQRYVARWVHLLLLLIHAFLTSSPPSHPDRVKQNNAASARRRRLQDFIGSVWEVAPGRSRISDGLTRQQRYVSKYVVIQRPPVLSDNTIDTKRRFMLRMQNKLVSGGRNSRSTSCSQYASYERASGVINENKGSMAK